MPADDIRNTTPNAPICGDELVTPFIVNGDELPTFDEEIPFDEQTIFSADDADRADSDKE